MKKLLFSALIVLFLFILLIGDLVHNHPIKQNESSTCPAYIFSITIHFEPVFTETIKIPVLKPLDYFKETYQQPSLNFYHHHWQTRAPPLISF